MTRWHVKQVDEHRAIFEAVSAGDAAEAQARMRRHLELLDASLFSGANGSMAMALR